MIVVEELGPCRNAQDVHHIMMGLFGGVSTLLSIWLAHRRKRADQERAEFYASVGKKLELPEWKYFAVARDKRKGNGR